MMATSTMSLKIQCGLMRDDIKQHSRFRFISKYHLKGKVLQVKQLILARVTCNKTNE